MKVIFNDWIPFKGFQAINLFGFLFIRTEFKDKDNTILFNHEAIHTIQMQELGYLLFYVLYGLEWFFKLPFYGKSAYDHISFEKEAYAHEAEPDYLSRRKPFAQWFKD